MMLPKIPSEAMMEPPARRAIIARSRLPHSDSKGSDMLMANALIMNRIPTKIKLVSIFPHFSISSHNLENWVTIVKTLSSNSVRLVLSTKFGRNPCLSLAKPIPPSAHRKHLGWDQSILRHSFPSCSHFQNHHVFVKATVDSVLVGLDLSQHFTHLCY